MIRVMKAINGSGLYFKGLDGDQNERNCSIWVRESHPHASYDRGVDLLITGEDNDHMLSVIMPVPYAQRFCNMINTGEYLTREFPDFDEYSSVNDLMSISWVILARKRDFCYQNFAFGKSDDGRYTITLRRHPGRYTAGSNLPMCRYLVFLNESDLHDLAHEIQQIIAFLKIKEKGGLKHDS